MLRTLRTLLRARSAEAEEALEAAEGPRILAQHLRDAQLDLTRGRHALAQLLAQQKAEERRADDAASEIARREEEARKALEGGADALAADLATRIVTLEDTRDIVPVIVQALAIYRFWIDLGLIDTYLGTIIAHTLIAIPYVIITVSATLANVDHRIEQAARNLGASNAQAVRLVILPAVMPGILSGALFAFTISFDEIVTVLFITSRAVYTLPKRIWNGIQDHLDPTIAAVATMLMLLTLALLLLDLWAKRRRRARMAALEET